MAQLNDTDLMLVNRGGVSYKATGAEVKNGLNPPIILPPTVIAPASGAEDLTTTPECVCTAPAVSNDNWVSTDWQVASDSGFVTVVASVTGHSDPTNWTVVPELEENTEYWIRAQHNGVKGTVSGYGPANQFKTEGGIPITNKPGKLYGVEQARNTLIKATTDAPALLVNFLMWGNHGYGIGVDGVIYQTNNPSDFPNLTWTQWSEYSDNKAISLSAPYNEGYAWIAMNSDNTLSMKAGTPDPPGNSKNEVAKLIAFGCVPNFVGFTTLTGECYVFCSDPSSSLYVGSKELNNNAWTDLGIVVPNGETIVKICGIPNRDGQNYQTPNIAILTDANNLYTVVTRNVQYTGGPPRTGTNSNPNLWLTDVQDVNPIDRSDILGGNSLLKTDGTIWVGFDNNRSAESHAFPKNTNWQQIGSDTDWACAPYSLPERQLSWACVKTDGLIYGNTSHQSMSYSVLNYDGNVTGPISHFGDLPDCQQGANKFLPLILPA